MECRTHARARVQIHVPYSYAEDCIHTSKVEQALVKPLDDMSGNRDIFRVLCVLLVFVLNGTQRALGAPTVHAPVRT
jgi:hypothetical protein